MAKKKKNSDTVEETTEKKSAEVTSSNNDENPQEPTDLDFYKGYKVNPYNKHPFPYSVETEPRILFKEGVLDNINSHAKEDTTKEQCGVLVGEIRYDDSGNYLYVVASIRGENAKNTAIQVSFTHETWDYINTELEKKYPEYCIVGWYHTHPGFGIFLSDMDKFIQDFFFNQPFHVALVVDPKANTKGIFAWIKGKIRPLSCCWNGSEKTDLLSGRVGGEENALPASRTVTNNVVPISSVKREVVSSKESEESDFFDFKKYFHYSLFFLLGFLFCYMFTSHFLSAAAGNAARAEMRELLSYLSEDYAIQSNLEGLINYINLEKARYNNSIATETITNAQYCENIDRFGQVFLMLGQETQKRRNKVIQIINSIQNNRLNGLASSEEIMNALKNSVGESILVQIGPYLESLSAPPMNETKIKEARNLLDHILKLCPEHSDTIKQRYPWIFN